MRAATTALVAAPVLLLSLFFGPASCFAACAVPTGLAGTACAATDYQTECSSAQAQSVATYSRQAVLDIPTNDAELYESIDFASQACKTSFETLLCARSLPKCGAPNSAVCPVGTNVQVCAA
jgi:hypothetical protein